MIYGMYLSTGGALAQSRRVDVIANNLANVSTPGFKPEAVLFRSVLAEEARRARGSADVLGGGVEVSATATVEAPGVIVSTGRPLDLAIRGRGYFAVERDGRTMLTRDGSFVLSATGEVVTSDGRGRLLGSGGEQLRLQSSDVVVGPDGTIDERGRGEVGRVAVWDFEQGSLLRTAGGFIPAPGAEGQRIDSDILQGNLEQSAVEPVREMTDMLEAFRVFEANMQFIRIQDATLARAVNDIARLQG